MVTGAAETSTAGTAVAVVDQPTLRSTRRARPRPVLGNAVRRVERVAAALRASLSSRHAPTGYARRRRFHPTGRHRYQTASDPGRGWSRSVDATTGGPGNCRTCSRPDELGGGLSAFVWIPRGDSNGRFLVDRFVCCRDGERGADGSCEDHGSDRAADEASDTATLVPTVSLATIPTLRCTHVGATYSTSIRFIQARREPAIEDAARWHY